MEYPQLEGTHEDISAQALTRTSLDPVQGPFQEGVGCTLICKAPHPAVALLLWSPGKSNAQFFTNVYSKCLMKQGTNDLMH